MRKLNVDVRSKIIDAAHHMFAEKGFPKTTIQDLVTYANCSKGGFYHHFSNKDDVMDAIMNSYIEELEESLSVISQENVFDALGNLIFKINALKSSKMTEWPKLIKILSFPDNEIFIRRMADSFSKLMEKKYVEIFIKGNTEGAFVVDHPNYLASLWTRELLELYGRANQVIFQNSEALKQEFLELVTYSEEILNATLKERKGYVHFGKDMTAYIEKGAIGK